MSSTETTVEEYIQSLPDDRKEAMSAIRQAIAGRLPVGFEEVMRWGMITYEVPLSINPDTYNKQPLQYAAIASQKNYISIYLSAVFTDAERREHFIESYKKTGKKLNMGKSCVRAKKLEDIPLEVISENIASLSVEDFIAEYENSKK